MALCQLFACSGLPLYSNIIAILSSSSSKDIVVYNNSLITCQGKTKKCVKVVVQYSRGGTYIGKAFHSVFWLSNYLTVGYSDGTRPTERFSAQESLDGSTHLLLSISSYLDYIRGEEIVDNFTCINQKLWKPQKNVKYVFVNE